MQLLHNKVRDVLRNATNTVGGIGISEPRTRTVLLDQFDDDVLKVAFPKQLSKESTLRANQILTLISSIPTAAPSKRTEIADKVLTIAVSGPSSQKDRTLDVHCSFPSSNREPDLWFDVRVTHSTQSSLLVKTYNFCCQVFRAEMKAGGTGLEVRHYIILLLL